MLFLFVPNCSPRDRKWNSTIRPYAVETREQMKLQQCWHVLCFSGCKVHVIKQSSFLCLCVTCIEEALMWQVLFGVQCHLMFSEHTLGCWTEHQMEWAMLTETTLRFSFKCYHISSSTLCWRLVGRNCDSMPLPLVEQRVHGCFWSAERWEHWMMDSLNLLIRIPKWVFPELQNAQHRPSTRALPHRSLH